MLRPYQRTVKIHDANGNSTEINLEVTHRNGYPEFTMSNESGQGQDRISPKGENQKKLLDIGHLWHLNGMNAGTEVQETALNAWGRKTYEENVEYLKLVGLYVTEYEGRIYQYGSSWIRKELPENFIDTLETLCDALNTEEDEHNANPITGPMIDEEFFTGKAHELNIHAKKLMAICLYHAISVDAIEYIRNEHGNNFCIEGQDYLVATEDEANTAHLEYIESLVDECGVKAFRGIASDPRVTMNQDGDIIITTSTIIIPASERGNSLASYDGREGEQEVYGETFYFYRR